MDPAERVDEQERAAAKRLEDRVAEYRGELLPLEQLVVRWTPEPIPLIPEVIPGTPDGSPLRVLVTAPSKNLKTWFVYEAVISLGTGADFLGLTPLVHAEGELTEEEGVIRRQLVEGAGERYKTLYVQLENTEYSMEVRGRAILQARGWTVGDEEADDPDVVLGPAGETETGVTILPRVELNLLSSDDLAALVEVASRYDIVVLDSTYNVVPQSLNDDAVAKAVTGAINTLVDGADLVAVFVIHHASTKGEGGHQDARESMGSTFFTSAFFDHEVRLNYESEQRVLRLSFVSRDVDYEPQAFRFNAPGHWEVWDEDEAADDALGGLREWLHADERNKVWEAGNGAYRVKGQFTTQGDLAAHLGITQRTMRAVIRRHLDLETVEGIQFGGDAE